jgi:hypothetical protein
VHHSPCVGTLVLLDSNTADDSPLMDALASDHAGWPALRALDTDGIAKESFLRVLDARQAIHPLSTVLITPLFLAAITTAASETIAEIRNMGTVLESNGRVHHGPSGTLGVQYCASWGVSKPAPRRVSSLLP